MVAQRRALPDGAGLSPARSLIKPNRELRPLPMITVLSILRAERHNRIVEIGSTPFWNNRHDPARCKSISVARHDNPSAPTRPTGHSSQR